MRNKRFELETKTGEKKILRFNSCVIDSKRVMEKKNIYNHQRFNELAVMSLFGLATISFFYIIRLKLPLVLY